MPDENILVPTAATQMSELMQDEIREILENHAFMADVVKIGGEGVSFSAWLAFLVGELDGFIGDFSFAPGRTPYTVAVARERDNGSEVVGVDLPASIADAVSARLSDISDVREATEVAAVIETMRAIWRAGGCVECSMSGGGLSFDFVRGRHAVFSRGVVAAFHQHGRTFASTALGPRVIRIGEDGACSLDIGGTLPFMTISSEENWSADAVVKAPGNGMRTSVPGSLSMKIARAVSGSGNPSAARGMLLSRGEDDNLMLVADISGRKGKPEVMFLPDGVRIREDGVVSAASECSEVEEILGFMGRGQISVGRFHEGAIEIEKAAYLIRTSAV